MILSFGLILAVAMYNVPAWTLLFLFVTWLPDVVFIALLKGESLQ